MFNIHYAKFPPHMYVIHYSNNKIIREGAGLSFFYYGPTSSLIAIPLESVNVPFIFTSTTSNFQDINIQGNFTYQISAPHKASHLLNFTVDNDYKYVSEDPQKLSERILYILQAQLNQEIEKIPLKKLLNEGSDFSKEIFHSIQGNLELESLGICIIGISILSIKPTAETSKALEAETREQIFKQADDALYNRRNESIKQERKIKENELQSEISATEKQKEIKEAEMEIKQSVQEKDQQLADNQLEFQIKLEKKKGELSELMARNKRIEAEASAYVVESIVKVIERVNPITLQALASLNMNPEQLIAMSFQEIGKKAEKIGQLNISPDLLQSLTNKKLKK